VLCVVCVVALPGAIAAEDATGRGITAYVQGNYELAFRSWTKAAEAGDRLAQFNLGTLYSRGEGVTKSIDKAVYWYRKAAEQGYPKAMYNVGEAYRTGTGVKQNPELARKWLAKAAGAGHAPAQTMLGRIYENGDGAPADIAEAVRWYRKAADGNDPEGLTLLATMYESGRGVERDAAIARALLTSAAEQGDATAQVFLADQWLSGRGGPQSTEEGMFWLSRAARQGVAMAFAKLGRLYESDARAGRNPALAYACYSLATRLDTKKSLHGRPASDAARVAAALDPEQLQAATEQAERWKIGDAPPKAPPARPAVETACARPEYPPEARLYELDGTTTVRFRIAADGEAVETQVAQSSGWLSLDAAATAAVSKCIFKPALRDGVPVSTWSTVQYAWHTGDGVASAYRPSPPSLVNGSCNGALGLDIAAASDTATSVKYRFITTADGQATQVRAERRAPDPQTDAAAVAFLSSCWFQPAMKDGQPVAAGFYLRLKPARRAAAR
jgi:TonB family protein